LKLPQQEQSENVIDVGVGENGSGDRGLTQAFSRMEFGSGFDLRAKIGRGSEQEPGAIVGAECNLGLSAGLAVQSCGADCAAVWAGAVPLGESSTCGRAEDLNAHDYGV
jgi:hypothetical protein